jgi:ATP-binding cassette subfamily G (WHITE) protein 2
MKSTSLLLQILTLYLIYRADIPAYWLWMHYISLFKYSYESLLANEFNSLKGVIWYEGLDSAKCLDKIVGGRVDQLMNVLIMIGFVILYRLIFYIALRVGTMNIRT